MSGQTLSCCPVRDEPFKTVTDTPMQHSGHRLSGGIVIGERIGWKTRERPRRCRFRHCHAPAGCGPARHVNREDGSSLFDDPNPGHVQILAQQPDRVVHRPPRGRDLQEALGLQLSSVSLIGFTFARNGRSRSWISCQGRSRRSGRRRAPREHVVPEPTLLGRDDREEGAGEATEFGASPGTHPMPLPVFRSTSRIEPVCYKIDTNRLRRHAFHCSTQATRYQTTRIWPWMRPSSVLARASRTADRIGERRSGRSRHMCASSLAACSSTGPCARESQLAERTVHPDPPRGIRSVARSIHRHVCRHHAGGWLSPDQPDRAPGHRRADRARSHRGTGACSGARRCVGPLRAGGN